MERRLAAILAADVVGYTRLMGADEAGTLRRLADLREEVLEPLITEHHGRIVKLMGDGLLVEFGSAVDSVACAMAWQDSVAQHESDGDTGTVLQFRIGINLGDVIVDDDDIHGDGMNIAARLDIQDRVEAIGFNSDEFSGHSLRAGFATSAATAGVSSWKIRQQTGHASDAMLTRYIRDGELFIDNAAGALL